MNKEKTSPWIYKIKTLPIREPRFASGLCSMFCLWLVLIPALIMVTIGIEFSLRQLIIPSLGSIVLATVLFSLWKRSALRVQEEKFTVADPSPELIEKRLNRLVGIATRFQWIGTAFIPLVVLTRNIGCEHIPNYSYASMIQGFSVVALVFSFALSRLYSHFRKKLEAAKGLTEEEKRDLQHEYFGKFLWPYVFWGGCFAIFSWL